MDRKEPISRVMFIQKKQRPKFQSHIVLLTGQTDRDDNRDGVSEGRGIGYAALAISIISLFVLPVLLGACGIIVGYIARRRGAGALGGWAMGIGIVSLVLGIFITPFF